ncbi:MAG: glycosyl transferase family 36, partial [Actinobacteria bacterium HGW-Actinobacteria-10]
IGAPVIAWRISTVQVPRERVLDATDVQEIHRIARRTWRFFETFVVPEGHNLAPDNFQEFPNGEVAWRTSPTNIGLQLLSTLGAHDLGYVTLDALVQRTSDTLTAMAGLERFRGHFYNWYDIRTLSPLPPNYISTVDSGNLAGHLLVLRVGLLEASEGPLLGPQLLSGVVDTATLAVEDLYAEADRLGPSSAVRALRELLDEIGRDVSLEERPDDLGEWYSLLVRLETLIAPVLQQAAHLRDGEPNVIGGTPHPVSSLDRMRESVSALGELVTDARTMLDSLAPWAALLSDIPPALVHEPALDPLLRYVPSLVGLAEGLDGVRETLRATIATPPEQDADDDVRWATEVLESLEASRPRCNEMLGRLRLNADIAREMWEHTDFKMLFDEQRLLFSIGYNTAEGRLDRSYYDMLASECRLASFLAIAKGDVPQEHWFRLGRSLTATPGGRALLSWSASMFEYLMPLLVMRSWPTTLLDQTYGAVVSRQIQYGRERGVPWGVSESAFNAKDAGLVYQYQAFGVPGLGLKRGLSDDIVIAPYATVLALTVTPCEAVENLKALAAQGARGRYGYYEAIDFTPGRVAAGESREVVKAYFAHHQGMSLIAMVNALSSESMIDRFHRDPMVQSAELLLQERVPRRVELVQPHISEVEHVRSLRELPPPVQRSYPIGDTPSPATHFLSNGRYSVMVTNSGGGYSRLGEMAVTRYREDITRDCWGQFFYVHDADTGRTWPATYNPYPKRPDEYHVTFSADKAEYRRTDGDLETHTEVSVSPEDNVEIRRITITNRGLSERRLEVTSYFEIALANQADDQSHKTFSNLFVETEVLSDTHTLLFSRRPRSSEATRPYGIHTVACETAAECDWSYETDRARFLGRLNGVDRPHALESAGPLSNTAGAVLDPCCAIRQAVGIEPGGSARFVFVTGVAETRDEAVRLSEKYHDMRSAQRAIDLAWTAAQIEMRDLGITPHESVVLQRLASRLLLTDHCSALKMKTSVENGLPMSGLWSIGISGDLPILLVRVEELEHAPLVRQALLAHQYWRHKGLVADLVILNTRPTSYADELDDRLRLLVRTGHALQLVDKPGGVFLRRADHMHPDVANLLLSVARATLEGDAGSIEVQLNRRIPRPTDPDPFVAPAPPTAYPTHALQRPELLFDNGLGGFDVGNDEYVIVLDGDDATPAPWINVMASPTFGCTVSEAGVGCTWAENSHENRITTWNNDPVTDGTGEMLYLRDEETGEFWSPTPLPVRAEEPYVVRHGKGYSRFEHTSHGLEQRVLWFVPTRDPVRIVRLSVRNLGERARRVSATQFVEWVLGSSRSKAQHQVVTWFDAEAEFLTAHNHFNPDFPGRAAFLACDCPLDSYTGSRTEFVGRNRRPANPAAMHRKDLGGLTGRFHDNCGALMTILELDPGEEKSVTFLLGQTPTLEQARSVVSAYRDPKVVDEELAAVRAQWDSILGTVKARTPDPALDLLVNGQLLYQALACRLWGRTATYQSSGAYGFRDQLQDVIALTLARPDLVREQIVEASRHQFERGDVLHWWQPVSGRGVRTRITDDRHWLPLVTSIYIDATGDDSVLDEVTAFIEGPEIEPDREDAYLQPAVSERAATVYEHCIAALQSGRGVGAHGLPLMGGGDWNDGMNRVGIGGEGESVWLGWFLNVTLTEFANICDSRGDTTHAEEFRARATAFVEAIEAEGWDGSWYRRAYFDDGTPLGSRSSAECRIDAIAQAWATISGAGDPERARRALDAVEDQLIDHEIGIVSLLTPPFDTMPHDPGYIKGYVPGVRENGGQYTHAAIWVAMAHLLRGNGDEGHDLISLINPVNHARNRDDAERYKVEPYVVAADVYSARHHAGRGGWTWYTGSASWFYRVAVRELLGLWTVSDSGQRYLVVDPCIPKSWKGYRLYFRDGETTYNIDVENPRGINRGVDRIELDGVRLEGVRVPLTRDGGAHDVRVTLLGG